MLQTTSWRIHDLSKSDRPRERLIRQGAKSLSNQELLAILLRTGTKDRSVYHLSMELLKTLETIQSFRDVTLEELMSIRGIGEAKAVHILAAVELGRRVYSASSEERYKIRSPKDAAAYVMTDLSGLQQEHFVALFLNVKNEVLHRQTIFIGGLNTTIVHPRELFKEAVRRSAASVIVMHNHPSGNPTPSEEDVLVTKRLVKAGEILGIQLLDHIIIGEYNFVSLKEKGYISR